MEPFAIGGTTYLPVRAVSSALGLDVNWNEATKTVELSKKKEEAYQITYQDCIIYDSTYFGTHYNAIVEVQNTGLKPLYLDDATFEFEDENGHLLEQDSYVSKSPSVIMPGEKGYFYSNSSLDTIKVGDKCVFVPVLSLKRAKEEPKRYDVLDDAMTVLSDTSLKITGRVENTTATEASIKAYIVLYRADGTPITVESLGSLNVAAGQKTSFDGSISLKNLGVTAADVASYQIFANKSYYQF